MRFTATIGDSKAVEIFIKIVGIFSKLSKKRTVIRVTANEFSFVNAYNLREGYSADFRIIKDQLFSAWIYDGISPDNNAIFFELSTDDLIHSLQAKENQIKLKLMKKDNVPHLRIELTANSLVNEIPITLILVRNWPDYNPPDMGHSSVAVTLPPVRTLAKILSAIKNMGAINMVFRINNVGEFSICAITDLAKVDVYARDLTNLSTSGLNVNSQNNQSTIGEYSSVVLDVRNLYPFINSLFPYISRLAMKIVNNRACIFCANEPECQLSLYMAGKIQD